MDDILNQTGHGMAWQAWLIERRRPEQEIQHDMGVKEK